MLVNNLLASRRDESSFNVEIRIRTDFTKGQPAECWDQKCKYTKNKRAR